MQTYTWMPTPGLGRHAPQQTNCSMVPSPTVQEQYFSGQQRMSNQQTHGLWNAQSSSQPVSSLSNMQSREMPRVWFNNSQDRLLQHNSAAMRVTLPNSQSTPLHGAQHGTPTQNLSCHSQTMSTNTVPQQNYNISPLHNVNNPTSVFWFSSTNGNESSATEQNNLTHQSVSTRYQFLNGYHNQMLTVPQSASQLQQLVLPNQAMHNNQGQIAGGNGALSISANHLPTTSQRLVAPSQTSNYSFQTGQIHSSHNENQVPHSSQIQHPPLPSRKDNNSASYSHLNHRTKLQRLIQNRNPSLSTNQHFITQSQPIQNQSLSRDSVQPQTLLQPCNARQVSGYHSNATLSPIQGSTQPQDLQLNNTTTGLASCTQNKLSTSTLTSSALPSSYITSTQNHSQLNLNNVLVGTDKTEVPVQSHGTRSLSCLRAMQEQTPSQMTTNTSYSQTPESALYSCTPPTLLSKEYQWVSEDQTGKKTAFLKENQHALCDQNTEGMQSTKLQAVSSTERKDGHECKNQHGEAQNSKATELVKLVMAMPKMLRQTDKAVAIVPPISQQASTLEKNDSVTTSSDENAIWTLDKESKNVEQESNAHSLPKKTTENLPSLVSATHHETQEQDKPQDRSSFDCLQHDPKCSDVPQSELGPTTSQDHTLETDKSSGSVSDLSNVQVFTLNVFKYWVKVLENIAEGTVKEPVENLIKYFIDLYWGGKVENLGKRIRLFSAELTSLYSKISVEEMLMAQFQYFHPKDFKKLPHGYHILKNDTNIPTEEFRSSWLNIDGRPADIEKVLAEPILDLMDYSLYNDFNPLQKNSESEPCTELNPAMTVNQKDDRPTVNHKMGDEELANSHVCESKSTEEVPNTQEALKKQECEEYPEKPQQQDANMNPEESIDSNEMADTMTESKIKSECEQVCRDATEIKPTSESTEHKDLCNDIDSSYDSDLIEFSLLSSGDAEKMFKEYTDFDLQKEPSRLCHDGAKDSATPDNESNVFCSSAHQIKFTCPHKTDTEIDWDGEHFCPRCWEETPLLDLDLEEAPLSPNKAGLESTPQKEGHHNQSYILQSGNSDLDCTVLSEGSSITDSPALTVDVFEVTLSEPGPNSIDAVSSCTSPSGKLPVKDLHASMFTESVRLAMPIEQVCETNGSVGPDIPTAWSCEQNRENLDFPKRVKTTRDEVCPPDIKPCKRLKLTKTIDIPAEYLNISGDIVTKKVSSSKHNPSEMNETPAEDGQNSIDEPLSPDKKAHRQLCSGSVGVSVSTKQDCRAHKDMYVSVPKKLSLSKKPEKKKLVIPSETKTSKDKVCSPVSPLYKKLKVIKTTTRPAEKKLFTPDIVVKKVGAPKPSPSGLSVSLTEDTHHWKDEKARGDNQQSSTVLKGQLKQHSNQSTMDAYGNGKKSSVKSQVSSVTPQPKRPTIVTNFDMTKDVVLGKTKQTQLNNEVKSVKLALYGLSSGHQKEIVQHQCTSKKFSTAPVHLTISNRSEPTSSYSNTPSAKQKVFSQWSSTFVETKKKTSHKKHQKPAKEELKSKTQELKRHVKDRLAMKQKQFSDLEMRK